MPASSPSTLTLAALVDELRPGGIRMDLGPFRRLMATLGSPQRDLPAVLLTGTNGKGSTAALLDSMLGAAGYRRGLYTSPRLERWEDLLAVDGRPIGTGEMAALLTEVVETADEKPTLFEALTAAAFLHFRRREVEVAVFEAGMGGERDATNLSEPVVSLVTTVDLDHAAWLGGTAAAVAADKAGVMRRGRTAVIGWIDDAEAAAVLEREVARRDAAGVFAARTVKGLERTNGRVALTTAHDAYDLDLHLAGEHQARNLALAVLAAEALKGAGFPRLDRAAIERGTAACRWPGRLEWADGPRRVLLDAAHNPGGMRALVRTLDGASFDLLFGALGDKDAATMLGLVAGRARRVVLTAPWDERSWDPRPFAPGIPGAAVEADLGAALDCVLQPAPRPLLVCGSLRLVGDVRGELRRRGFRLAGEETP